jgi:glyoxylase-like metal-dependent hydrolase (beta-lactamase superfamily II)
MTIHHLNCGTMREIDPGTELAPARALNHVLLVETADALVLVDSGFGTQDVERASDSLGPAFLERVMPVLEPGETALEQVKKLGFAPEDVRHIVLTHLDLDHSGGISDFPHATVHLHEAELRSAMAPGDHPEHNLRYRPMHWAHRPQWSTYTSRKGNSWFGFDALELAGLPPEILLIPLAGHTAGHCAVAMKDGEKWLLHAGDAIYHHGQVEPGNRWSMPLWEAFEEMTEVDRPLRLANQSRLRELLIDHGAEVEVFSAHDPWAFQRHAGMAPAL